jgi:HSP20 family protein
MAELNPKEKQENKPSGTPAGGQTGTPAGGQTAQGQQPQSQTTQGQQPQSQGGAQAGGLATRRTPPSSLAAGNPFALMRQLADEMDRVFENFGFGRSRFGFPSLLEGFPSTPTWSPQVEVLEKDGRLIVRADVPGLKKEDLKVELTDDALIIQGERKREHEDKGEGSYRSERVYGSFYRVIPLPEGTSTEGATATFKDGVLEVSLQAPRREEKRAKQIQVK